MATQKKRQAGTNTSAMRRELLDTFKRRSGEIIELGIIKKWEFFQGEMRLHGFGSICGKDIDDDLRANGFIGRGERTGIIKGHERVFNLGLGRGRSNFFVFARIKMDGKNEYNEIEIFYTNPEKGEMSKYLTPDEIYIKRTIKIKDSLEDISNIIKEIIGHSGKKAEDDFRMQCHFHSHRLFGPKDIIFDDGGSKMEDIIRRLMLYHTDVWVPTPHNSTSERMHKMMQIIAKTIGNTYAPGFELTMTLGEFNGPHMVVICNSIAIANQLRREILDRRDNWLNMQPYFSGMFFQEMFPILEEYKKKGQIALFIPHCILKENSLLPLYITGLYSSVETGLMELEDAENYAKKCSAIAVYNNLGSNKCLKLENSGIMRRIRKAMKKVFGRRAKRMSATANSSTMAIAKSLEMDGMGTCYESDEHETKPLGEYAAGGDGFGAGFTQLVIHPDIVRELIASNRKLAAKDVVFGIELGSIKTRAVTFVDVKPDGTIEVEKARMQDPHYSKRDIFRLKWTRWWGYVKNMAKTIVNLLIEEKWEKLAKLTE